MIIFFTTKDTKNMKKDHRSSIGAESVVIFTIRRSG
jgi:hypothetical protein